jgi:hypothetical protein
MVRGLETFRSHFLGFEDSYVLIGGTACDLWMGAAGLPFRATKDLDVVLVVEALRPGFVARFWEFVKAAKYESLQQSERRPEFYRFTGTSDEAYPFMIELLSRNVLDLPEGTHLTPIPADEDISSLSAILLDDAYYEFVMASRMEIDGVPTIPAQCLMPLKARAYLDLLGRREQGDPNVKGSDIKKHRNDVFRLYVTLAAADRFDLPDQLATDLRRFLNSIPEGERSAIQAAVGSGNMPDFDETAAGMRRIFQL